MLLINDQILSPSFELDQLDYRSKAAGGVEGMSIVHKATGYVQPTVEYNEDRSIAAIHCEHIGGDVIAVSHDLLREVDPRFLKYHDGVIEFRNVDGATVLSYAVIDQDEVCVLARRKESSAVS